MKRLLLLLCIFISTINNAIAQRIIGIVPDTGVNKYQYSDYRTHKKNYTLNFSYINNISVTCSEVGDFLFIILPYQPHKAKSYAKLIDGVIMSGGGDHEERLDFEKELIVEMMKRKKPILGICLGLQTLNVVNGGKIALVKELIPNPLVHRDEHIKLAHTIKIDKTSLLYKIAKKEQVETNSFHNFAISELAPNLKAASFTSDGVIESIEMPNYKGFFLGVQWHPEFLLTDTDRNILQSFCKAVKDYSIK